MNCIQTSFDEEQNVTTSKYHRLHFLIWSDFLIYVCKLKAGRLLKEILGLQGMEL